MTEPTEIRIKGFHPLDISLPEGDTVQGVVRIVLPDIHVQLLDLSMGGILQGAHIGSDAALYGYELELPESVEISKLMQFVIASREQLEEMWKLIQAEYDKKGALLG